MGGSHDYERIVTALRMARADLRSSDRSGKTPLHLAVTHGDKKIVRAFLEAGADPDARDRRDDSALDLAVTHGHEGMLKVLLAGGADPNARGRSGYTALHSAASLGREKIVRALLEAGASIDAKDKDGSTALSYACNNRTGASMALFLLERGADPFLGKGPAISLIEERLKEWQEKKVSGCQRFKVVHDMVKKNYSAEYMDWWMAPSQ